MKIPKIKFRKYIPNAVVALITLVIIWVSFAPAFPVKPSPPKKPFQICDIGNLVSWNVVQGRPAQISSLLSFVDQSYLKVEYLKVDSRVLFSCTTTIPWFSLYRASSIGLKTSANQPMEITLVISRNGAGGPLLEQRSVGLGNGPQEVVWELDNVITPKGNWLTGDYDSVGFFVWPLRPGENFGVSIYEVYLR